MYRLKNYSGKFPDFSIELYHNAVLDFNLDGKGFHLINIEDLIEVLSLKAFVKPF